jgi:Fe-S cluster biogenesis protein NfuA
MFIQISDTPNPESLKFTPDEHEISSDNISEYKNSSEADNKSPLAEELFQIIGVKSIFFGIDFITITKDTKIQWEDLKTEILSTIMDFISSGRDIFYKKENNDLVDDDDGDEGSIVKQIKELIEIKIRPAVAMDGGDITFNSFVDGVVYLNLKGSCSSCPSSTVTLKNGIESMLKHYIPEVQSVEQIFE